MSAPSDGARGDARKARAVERVAADERVVAVLDEHFIMWLDLDDKEGPPGEWYCSCDAKFGFSYTAIRHVAEVLAGVIADAKAEAWDEGYARGVRDELSDVERADNPYRMEPEVGR